MVILWTALSRNSAGGEQPLLTITTHDSTTPGRRRACVVWRPTVPNGFREILDFVCILKNLTMIHAFRILHRNSLSPPA
jgi:hypothetical protein